MVSRPGCWGCQHAAAKFSKQGRAQHYCSRHQRPATDRCADYLHQRKAVRQAINFYRQTTQ